ncbi:MAG: DUF2142 domain-containing protein [Pseudomonadota bacterium]
MPLAFALALITPPFQNPDEDGHFLRAVQIAGGEFTGRHLAAGGSGGRIDPAARVAGARFKPLAGPSRAPARSGDDGGHGRLALGAPHPRTPAFPTRFCGRRRCISPPPPPCWSVAPSTCRWSRPCACGRLVNAAFAVALGFAALWLWPTGRALLFTALSLPMALSLYGSTSHDGLMITVSALALALILRGRAATSLIAALLLGLVAAGRPVYAPLVLLPLLDRPGAPRAWLGVAIGAACIAAWAPFAEAARIEFSHDGLHIDSAEQLAYLLGHPLAIPGIALDTLRVHGREYIIMVIGALGALDTLLPKPYYALAALILLAAVITDAIGPGAGRGRGLLLGILLVGTGAVFFSQYMIWSAVGGTVIEGVQGRYFLPFAPRRRC